MHSLSHPYGKIMGKIKSGCSMGNSRKSHFQTNLSLKKHVCLKNVFLNKTCFFKNTCFPKEPCVFQKIMILKKHICVFKHVVLKITSFLTMLKQHMFLTSSSTTATTTTTTTATTIFNPFRPI